MSSRPVTPRQDLDKPEVDRKSVRERTAKARATAGRVCRTTPAACRPAGPLLTAVPRSFGERTPIPARRRGEGVIRAGVP